LVVVDKGGGTGGAIVGCVRAGKAGGGTIGAGMCGGVRVSSRGTG